MLLYNRHNRKITSRNFIPFINIGNKYEPSDSIWLYVITSITTASEDWVFKPILWDFKGDENAEADVN